MEEKVAFVRGRRIEHADGEAVQALIRQYESVVVDLGTGDGRWLYRLARSRPTALCLGVDANKDALREASFRASRKHTRGGLHNIRFIAAAVELLPGVFREVADEVWVAYPWGSLLRAVLVPDPSVLRRVAGILKARGTLRVAINESVLGQADILERLSLAPSTGQDLYDAMRAGYNEAGLTVTTWRRDDARVRSSWGARLGQGRTLPTLWVEAVKDGDRRNPGG